MDVWFARCLQGERLSRLYALQGLLSKGLPTAPPGRYGCHIRGRSIDDREGHSTARADGVSVYYPFALVELLSCREADDNEAGEVLLSFLDEDGCQVTVRLRREVADAVCKRLAAAPDPAE